MVMLNVRSLRNKVVEIENEFNGFDVICLCETWLDQYTPDVLLNIDNYVMFRLDRSSNVTSGKRGGGICIYVKDKFSDYISVLNELLNINDDIEQLWLQLACPNVKNKCIGCVYRPPKGSIPNCLSNLEKSLDHLNNFNSEIILTGDFNINYNLRHTDSFKLLKDFEHKYDLNQIIESNTRTTSKSSTRIDLMFSNVSHVLHCGVIACSISDHDAIYLIKKKVRCKHKHDYIKARSYQHYVKEDYQSDIVNDPWWLEYHTSEDVNIKWDIFEKIVEKHADVHCPVKQIRVRIENPKWFSKELAEEIYHRNRLYKAAKLSKKMEDWESFKIKKNEVKKLLHQAREEFIKDKLEQDKNDPKKFWRSINKLTGLGKNKTKIGLREIITNDGVSVKGLDAANYMNEFYTNAGPNLAAKFNDIWSPSDCVTDRSPGFSFDCISDKAISKLVNEIKISKSSAMGTLSSRILKDAFQVWIFQLSDIFNTCLSTGQFPKSWGEGKITPIPKVTIFSKKPEDWRPITQIKLSGKLLERCVHSQLYSYFDEYFLDDQQHGFRPNRSTSTAVFEMLKSSYQSWNDKLFQTCVFIDFSRAFDCIDHQILLSKLKLYGLDRMSIQFISSYFKNRYQTTVIDGNVSTVEKVTYGTAQGSILGPLIFIIYVNDLFNEINDKNNIIMYADDTLITSSSKSSRESVLSCQMMLDKIMAWCDKNKLTINIKKTKCMYINSHENQPNVKLSINDVELETVNHFEYLGMHIDNKLSMGKHVESILKKARCKLGILYKIRQFISCKTSLLIYKVMIRPHLEYGDFIIESSNVGNIDKLERLQEKCLRLSEYQAPAKRKEMSMLKIKFRIEDLKIRRKRSLLRLMHNQSKNAVNLVQERPNMILRSDKKIKMKSDFTRLTKIQRSPYYRGLSLWNTLPEYIQRESSKVKFKVEVKTYIK